MPSPKFGLFSPTRRAMIEQVHLAINAQHFSRTAEARTWLGAWPVSRFPAAHWASARAADIWLAFDHAHWGLTLGPPTGRLIAEMRRRSATRMPYAAERFSR
jgi:glycine/D-amino acid oxidase-like deaminating enzyme